MKNLAIRLSGLLAAGLVVVASTSVTVASAWVFAYQPKTPKTLLKKSL